MSKHIKTTIKSIRSHWAALGFEFGDACFACANEVGLERAHIVADSDGGEDAPGNLLVLCRDCHRGPMGMPDLWGENWDSNPLVALAWPLTYPLYMIDPILRHRFHKLLLFDFLGENQFVQSPYGEIFRRNLVTDVDIREFLVMMVRHHMEDLQSVLTHLDKELGT